MRRTVLLLMVMGLALVLASGIAWAATKTGTNGNDNLRGTSDNDRMYGLDGNDTIYANDDTYDYIDCGEYQTGSFDKDVDTAEVDAKDQVINCENTTTNPQSTTSEPAA